MPVKISPHKIVLFDNWLGSAPPPKNRRKKLTTKAMGHDAVKGAHPPGAKFHVWAPGRTAKESGWSTCIYLQSPEDGPILRPGTICPNAPEAPDMWRLGRIITPAWFVLQACAVVLTRLEPRRWGWFWCGGHPPPGLEARLLIQAGTRRGGLTYRSSAKRNQTYLRTAGQGGLGYLL